VDQLLQLNQKLQFEADCSKLYVRRDKKARSEKLRTVALFCRMFFSTGSQLSIGVNVVNSDKRSYRSCREAAVCCHNSGWRGSFRGDSW